jgi:SAM-dependent methyltransferase
MKTQADSKTTRGRGHLVPGPARVGAPPFVCPLHGLALDDGEGGLVCPEGDRFPTIAGIPRFVENAAYADAFGAQWIRYRALELDSVTGRSDSLDRLRRCLGDGVWAQLDGMSILECGCGAGRFTEILLQRGAFVTAIDLSQAVEANRDTCAGHERHRVAQADLRRLPFPPQSFQLVLCLGVIQHTPDPEQTIETLYRYVAPGGSLVIDHYSGGLGWALSLKPLYRAWLKRQPPGRGLQLSERLVDRFLPLHRRAASSRVLQFLLSRVSPVLHFHGHVHDATDEQQRKWAQVMTHDALTDWYKHRRSRRAINTALQRLGLTDIWCEPGGNGIEARGRRGG